VVIRWKYVALVGFVGALGAAAFLYLTTPQGFIPEDDQGYLMVIVQAPQGASLDYTQEICKQVEQIVSQVPDVSGAFTIVGFSFSGSASNRAIVFLNLKDFSERKGKGHEGAAIVEQMRGPLSAVKGGLAIPFSPPAVQGLGQFGGFTFELEDLGRNSLQGIADAANKLIGAGNASKDLTGLFTSYTANDPQFLVKIDREKAKSLQIPFTQVTDALQVYMGSVYVNDFDFNNRSYRVYLQADQQFRSESRDIRSYYLKSDTGKMVPLDNIVEIQQTQNPQVITHYNLFRSAEINGSGLPGKSTGEALQAMADLAKKELPRGMTFEWSGLSQEEIESGGKAAILFGLGLVVVYLTLAAQYESYVLPFIVLLGVPVALLGALGAVKMRGLTNDVYCQIGLIMLIGLSSKNAILIVEFAEQLQEEGMSAIEAAIEAARIRLRPILMTSLAFIFGVMPLVWAVGAGAELRQTLGIAVFAGMIGVTVFGLIFTPVFYVACRRLADLGARRHPGLASPPREGT
jgi:hydrophobic/amphiphilic exporter-1 (mainly G- bacteria), HAE1 family